MIELPRAYTSEEVRDQILDHLRDLVDYWADPDIAKGYDTKERLSGLAFSILATLDGCSDLPAFTLVPCPHEDDKEFHISEGENYFDSTPVNFALHEFWHKRN